MTTVGQIEKKTQQRIVTLFREQLGYDYLGDWSDRENNRNVEPALLHAFLKKQDHEESLISRTLHLLDKAATDQSKKLYDRNKGVYDLLRYGVKVKPDVGENTVTVWLIDWKHPHNNHFAIAEEVTVKGADAKAYNKRPDIVLYVNGIALGVLELKRSTVSVSEGIRQNLDNQKKVFIEHFFSTLQLIMAGNDTEGLRYGTIETPEKYYLNWKEDSTVENLLDRGLLQTCSKERLLELIHNFVVFDAGTKKLCRHNHYFGVRAAQEFIKRREGGIIWHTQGSGKSLTMVWLAKWIRENVSDIRAEESEKISAFDDLSLIELIVERGESAINSLPKGIRNNRQATAETIENNVRKLIIDEHPINPKYYEEMSELLLALIEQRRQEAISYQEYLNQIVALTRKVKEPWRGSYPPPISTKALQALYDNLDKDAVLAEEVNTAVKEIMQDDWRDNVIKVKKVKNAIKAALGQQAARTDDILTLVKKQHDY